MQPEPAFDRVIVVPAMPEWELELFTGVPDFVRAFAEALCRAVMGIADLATCLADAMEGMIALSQFAWLDHAAAPAEDLTLDQLRAALGDVGPCTPRVRYDSEGCWSLN